MMVSYKLTLKLSRKRHTNLHSKHTHHKLTHTTDELTVIVVAPPDQPLPSALVLDKSG